MKYILIVLVFLCSLYPQAQDEVIKLAKVAVVFGIVSNLFSMIAGV